MMRPVNILLSAFLLTLAPWCLNNALAQSTARWLPVDVQQFFIMPDQPAMVAFTLADASELTTAGGVQGYRICDYQDQLIKQGQAQRDGAGLLTVKLTLPRGFYTLSIDGTKQVFGIASLEPFDGPVDDLFCMDSAMSWLVVQKNHYTRYQDFVKTRDQLVGVLKRSGIAMSRERLSWQGIEPQAGQWDWQTPRQFDSMRQTYQRHGVPIMEMFHHAPAYLGRTIGGHFPQDLHATALSFAQLQSRWQAGWGSVEIWNEPNIGGEGKVPADQYVPLAKAIRYAASKHDGHVPVGGPALAGYDKAYLSDLAENGLLANMDYMSFHTYSRAASLEQITSQYRDVLGAYQQQSIPVWITESGRPWTKGNDRPLTEDALDTALDNVMKVIEAKACGIERYFMFVYPFYEEHSRNFGVMDRLGTPLKAMAGYCHAVLALANKSYLGDWPTDDPQIVRARVFADQQDAVLVLYTASTAAEQPVKLKLPANAVVLGIDGRHLSPASNDQINVADGLVYVRLPREQIQSLIQTDTPAMQLNRMAKQAREGFESPSPIVMQFMPDEKDYRPGSNGYHLTGQSQNPNVLLSVRLVNLDDKPHELTVQLKRDDSLVDAAKTLTLAANTTGKVTWSIPAQWREQRHVKLSVQAQSDSDAGVIQPVVINLLGEIPLDQMLEDFTLRHRVPIDDAKLWQMVATPQARAESIFPGQQIWQLDADFSKATDTWVYPRLRLPVDVDMQKMQGMVLQIRARNTKGVRVFCWEQNASGQMERVGYITPKSIIADDDQWHVVYIPFNSLILSGANGVDPNNQLDLDQIKRISIGFNGKKPTSSLHVKQLWLVGQ